MVNMSEPGSENNRVRVLLADDQPLLRTGFRLILEAEPDIEVIGEAVDGADAVRIATRERPDVVLMDIRMPVMDGVSATRELANVPGVRVIILTTFDLDSYVVDALRAGASGFLLKDARATDLVQAVRVVAAGDAVVAPTVTRRLLDRFARELAVPAERDPADPLDGELSRLTERELEVLRLVARGLSNAEIAAQLVVTETTVKTHVHNLLSKLGQRDRVQLVVLAYEAGLVTPKPLGTQ
jgi:DNA-binding NarL/FixJ family response regulator